MTQSTSIRIELAKSERINRLVLEYGLFSADELEEKILKVSKRLGGLGTKNALHELHNQNMYGTAEQLLKYYDKAYHNCLQKKSSQPVNSLNYNHFDLDLITQDLIKEANKLPITDNIYE